MKNYKLYITIAIISIVLILFVGEFNDDPKPIKSQPQFATGPPIQISIDKQKDLVRKSNHYVRPEMIPDEFKDFHDMNQGKRLRMVTELMQLKDLDKEYLDFFKAEIFNRAHMDTVRNNMANALCWQRKPNPALHELFIKMLDDEAEDPDWRDYCIQFLSECFETSDNKPLIIETWIRYSKGKDSLAGTALIHLAYQEGNNNIKIEPDFMIEHLDDPKVSIDTKTSILAIIGKRKDVEQLPVLRKFASQDKNAALKSVAIGSLGLIGVEPDLKIINLALYHENGRVVLAARAAKTRIEKRISDEEIMKKVIEAMEQIKKKKYPIAEPEIR